MNQQKEFANHLLNQWLAEVDPFDHRLESCGETYQGNPVFCITVWVSGGISFTFKVYRYTPLNSEWPKLAFVPVKD